MSIVEEMGDRLAAEVLAAMDELGDDRFFEKVSKILSDGSPTLQEAFMTAIRVRIADKRARLYLEQSLGAKRGTGAAPKGPFMGGSGH